MLRVQQVLQYLGRLFYLPERLGEIVLIVALQERWLLGLYLYQEQEKKEDFLECHLQKAIRRSIVRVGGTLIERKSNT